MRHIIAIMFSIVCCSLNIWARPDYGIVGFSVNYMREQPSYSAELGNQCLMGTVVEILDSQGYWLKIKSPEPYTAWVNEMGVVKVSQEELENYLKAPKYICTVPFSKIFSQPSEQSEILSDMVMGDIVRVWNMQKKHPAKAKIVIRNGFAGVIMPSGKTGFVKKQNLARFDSWAKNSEASAEKIISTAKKFLGVPYMWGGASIKGVDCSGLTRMAWFMNGVLIPRDTGPQSRCGTEVSIFDKDGKLDISALLPGDLLFFGSPSGDGQPVRINHVGIYMGDGRFVHSSQIVRISSLRPEDADYYTRVPVIARRYIGKDAQNGLVGIKDSPFYFQR